MACPDPTDTQRIEDDEHDQHTSGEFLQAVGADEDFVEVGFFERRGRGSRHRVLSSWQRIVTHCTSIGGGGLRYKTQPHRKGTALADCAFDLDSAFVQFDDFSGNAQA